MTVLDHLENIDRIIGYPQGRGSGILTVLEELDKEGVSMKDGLGKAVGPSFSEETAATLYETRTVKSSLGGNLVLFYTTECVFSNYHPASLSIDGNHFPSSEHYFMWTKAKTFKDEKTAEEILSAGSPAEAKRLGRQVDNFKDEVWKGASIRLMTVACYRKFQQNPSLRKALFSTVGSVLVEAAPSDRIWGIGMGTTNKNAADPKKWKGTNNLGRILTVIREHMICSKLYDHEL